ncbi:MAG: hypothetical protein PUC06_07390 [Oscillospiraceae bacterium]|nr:hypothetical protein [Oscillospiraceae bacterium]
MEEKELIEQAGKRDAEAFLTLVKPYVREIYDACHEKYGEPEELFQSVCLRAWHGIPLFQHDMSIEHWLMDLLEDEARKHRKKSAKNREVGEKLSEEQLLQLVRGSILGETERSSPLYFLKRIRFTLIALIIVVFLLLVSHCQERSGEVVSQTPAPAASVEVTEAPAAAFAPGA